MNQSFKKKYTLSDGTVVVFSRAKLKSAILRKKIQMEKNGKKYSQQAILEDIADETGISFGSIKHWLSGHNAPSDLDKVKDLAQALDVEMECLFEKETEDDSDMNTDMNNKVTMTADIDYSTVKGTVRSIYSDMVNYIEMFRMLGITNTEGKVLKLLFMTLYRSLMHARLDLPQEVFKNLCSFSVNFLQQLGSYLEYIECISDENFYEPALPDSSIETPEAYLGLYADAYNFPPCAPWSECLYVSVNPFSKDCKAFERAVMEQYKWDCDNELEEIPNEILIEAAYARLEEILKDYIVK